MLSTNYHVLFAPGNNSSVPQLARYCDHVTSSGVVKDRYAPENKDEKFMSYRHCAKFFGGKRVHCVTFAEIMDTSNSNIVLRFLTTVFMWLRDYLSGIDRAGYRYFVNPFRSNLGQDADIDAMEAKFQEIIKEDPHAEVVVFCVSRGCQASINWLAHHPHPEVKAIIIEGGLSRLEHVIEYSTSVKRPFLRLARFLLIKFADYKSYGPHAILCLDLLPKKLPILFVHSVQDDIVPIMCGTCMTTMAIKSNDQLNYRENITLFGPRHDTYLSHSEEARAQYIKGVNNFFEKHLLLSKK